MKMKETADDISVKESLWGATLREVMRFSEKYAAGHVKGERYSEAQRDVTHAAKAKKYPKTLIRDIGNLIIRGEQGGGNRLQYHRRISRPDRAVI